MMEGIEMGTIFIIIIMAMRIIQHYYSKRISEIFPVSLAGRSKYVYLSMGTSAFFAFALLLIGGENGRFSWVNILLATISGLALAGANVFGTLALRTGTIVLSSIFGTAGLIVPCICGVFFFDEKMTVWQWGAVGVFIYASWMLTSSEKNSNTKFSWGTMLLLIGNFCVNGITMLCQKLLTYTDPNANISLYSFFTFSIPAVLFLVIYKINAREKPDERLNRKIYFPVFLIAFVVFLINQLATTATNFMPSTILFAVLSCGNTIVATLVGAFAYKEKPNARTILGLVICALSLIIINSCK